MTEDLISPNEANLGNLQTQYKTLENKHQKLLKDIEEIQKETDEVNEQYRAGSQELKDKQEELDKLRRKLTVNNQEIERLKALLEDLKGKTNSEKVIELEGDLNRQITMHEELFTKQTKLQKDLEKKQKLITVLNKALAELESERNKLDKALAALQYMNEEELQKKVVLTSQRVKEAVKIKASLEGCVVRLKEILNSNNAPIYNELHEDLILILNDINQYLDNLMNKMTEMSQRLFSNLGEEK